MRQEYRNDLSLTYFDFWEFPLPQHGLLQKRKWQNKILVMDILHAITTDTKLIWSGICHVIKLQGSEPEVYAQHGNMHSQY